jgi:DNA-binding FadR family transcriptional regulator
MRVLEALGVVSVRRGAEHGTVLMPEPGNAFATSLGLLVDLRHVTPAELIQFRLMLETSSVRIVSSQRNPETLAELDEIVSRMESERSGSEYHLMDASFHITLVKSTGNRLFDLVEAGIDDALRAIIADVSRLSFDQDRLEDRLTSEHRAILEAIMEGDCETAVSLLGDHINYWGRRVVELNDSSRAGDRYPAPHSPDPSDFGSAQGLLDT